VLEHFETHGWVRIPRAFDPEDAAAMRDVTWRALEQVGIRRDDPSTWSKERPDHLQRLKKDPVFQRVATERTLAAIDAVLEGQPWPKPKDWGAFFLVFPTTGREFRVPTTGWHLDAPYMSQLAPPRGVKVHAMYGDVLPRAGGMNIISGSHRMVHKWFVDHPETAGLRSAKQRRSLHEHPFLRAVCAGEVTYDTVEEVDGIRLQVVENTAQAGDVILMHSLLLHAPPAAHCGTEPRFLLNKDLWLGGWPD